MTEDALSETIKSEFFFKQKARKRIQAIQSLIRLHRLDWAQAEAHIKRLIKTFSDIDLGGYPISRYRIVPEGKPALRQIY